MAELTVDQAFQIALQHHQAGQLPQAEQIYRQILAQVPEHAEALHHLGVIAHQMGRNDIAVDLIERAVVLNPHLSEAFSNLGSALQAMGQLDKAIVAGRKAIALRPTSAEAYCNLGVTLKTSGQLNEAVAAYRQAIILRPDYAEAYGNLGVALKKSGHLDEAAAAYRQAIILRPDFAEAHNNLGNALKDRGQLNEAIVVYRRAIALRPNHAQTHYNLGIALKDSGQLDGATAAYGQAIALSPDFPEAHSNLGVVLKDKGQLDEAIAAYRRAIDLRPDYAEAHNNLGVALKDKGHLDEAIAAYRRAIDLRPEFPEAYSNLGNALHARGQLDEALAACWKAISLRPSYAEAYINLGNAQQTSGQLDEAITASRRAIVLRPDYPEAHNNLGIALANKGQVEEAIAAYRKAITFRPDFPEVHRNLGNVLLDNGLLDEAVAAYRHAIALRPDFPEAHSNLVLILHLHAAFDAYHIAEEHRRWNRQHAEPLKEFIRPHANDRGTDRRLRIGYVSPDFRQHPVGRFLLPLLENHDKSRFEVFAYAQVPAPDAMTQRLRSCTDTWRSIVGLSDAQAAELVRQDQIDILVDLAMHTAHNRLLVFARKPAPVQVTWLAYCSTTGLQTIDYRLSDPYLDPPGQDESFYSEQTIRLPETYWCYQPGIAPPDVGPLPASQCGHVTFGCLNNFCKVSEPALAAWCALLRALPGSRLLLHAHQGSHRQQVQERLEREGIESQRLEFAARLPTEEYFNLYRRIDIALDTFPYGGGTTTCDALWMGVPVVSLVGKTAVGRGGLSILSNIGLPELAARSQEEYVRLASELANDLPRLGDLRSTLRRRMEQSTLMDAPRFARNIEAAYREMWRKWCQTDGRAVKDV